MTQTLDLFNFSILTSKRLRIVLCSFGGTEDCGGQVSTQLLSCIDDTALEFRIKII